MFLFLPHVVDEDSEEVENVGLESGRCTDVEHRDEQREKLEEKGIRFCTVHLRQSNNDYLVTNTTSTVAVCVALLQLWYHFSLRERSSSNLCHEVVVTHSLRQLAGHPLHEGVQDTQDDESHLIRESSLQFHV